MRVAILGCGAMGTVLGAYMTKNGCDVELIDSYEAHVEALNTKGAHIVGTVDFTVPVKAITPAQMTFFLLAWTVPPLLISGWVNRY